MMHHLLSHPQQIAAILPRYCEDGDRTVILSMDGETIRADVLVRTLMNRLADCQAIDLNALRRRAQKITQGHILQPLAFAPEVLLCPMKIRHPSVKRDNCTGYINAHAIHSVEPAEQEGERPSCVVRLRNGIRLNVLTSADTIQHHLQTARVVEDSAPYQQAFQHCREAPVKVEARTRDIKLKPGQDIRILLEISSG